MSLFAIGVLFILLLPGIAHRSSPLWIAVAGLALLVASLALAFLRRWLQRTKRPSSQIVKALQQTAGVRRISIGRSSAPAGAELCRHAERRRRMALYATGSGGSGRYAEVYQAYWNQLVPESGRCNTVQGELIRVIGRLAIEYYRNGNMNWEDGYDLMLVWMSRTLHDQTVFEPDQLVQIQRDVASIRANAESGCCPYADGEDEYDRLTDRIVEWCRRRSDPLTLTDELPYDH